MKKLLTILASVVFCTVLDKPVFSQNGSASDIKYIPKFDYTPVEREKAASADVTIATLNTIFIDRDINQAGSPWSDFAKSLNSDLEELLTAKGFKVRGPFNSRDEMVFNDKQNSDFVLAVTVNMSVDNQRKWKRKHNYLSNEDTWIVTNGSVNISCSIDLTIMSTMHGEKLWKKNLSLPVLKFDYKGTTKWQGTDPSILREMRYENNLSNPLCKKLEEEYQEAVKVLWNQFDVQEMKTLASESKIADKKN